MRDILNDGVLTGLDRQMDERKDEFMRLKQVKADYIDAMGYTAEEIEEYQTARPATEATTGGERETARPVARQADAPKLDGRTAEGRVASAMDVDAIALNDIQWNIRGDRVLLTTREGRALRAADFITDKGEWTDAGSRWFHQKDKAEAMAMEKAGDQPEAR